ncbi:hypothetical protein AB0W03_22440, partial [Escherichia coli]
PQNDVTLKMPAFEWVHVQLHQQKGMISLSPPTICNSALCRTSEHSSAREESVQFIISAASSLPSRSLQGHIIYMGNMSLVLSLIIMQSISVINAR